MHVVGLEDSISLYKAASPIAKNEGSIIPGGLKRTADIMLSSPAAWFIFYL